MSFYTGFRLGAFEEYYELFSFFEQNELVNIELNIPKSFFLSLNRYLILLDDVLKLGVFREDLFHWALGRKYVIILGP